MEPLEESKIRLEEAEEIILRWDSTTSEKAREKLIFKGGCLEVDRYLHAVDLIQGSMSSISIFDNQNKVNMAIQIAMARLEDKFCNILLIHTSLTKTNFLIDPSSSTHSFASTSGGGGNNDDDADFKDNPDEDKEEVLEENFIDENYHQI